MLVRVSGLMAVFYFGLFLIWEYLSLKKENINIDEKKVRKLASINCSYKEMAAVLDCNESTLTRNFAQVIEKGRDEGKMSLKRKQWEVAMGGNVSMLIWLGKQILGQRDAQDLTAQIDTKSEVIIK
jgi:hypothetical protein